MESRVRRMRGGEAPTRKEQEQEEKLYVSIVYTDSDGSKQERTRQETLTVRRFLTEPAYVRVNAGVTKNMGAYESLRVDVAISVPCYVEEIDNVFPVVADKVAGFLDNEVQTYQKG